MAATARTRTPGRANALPRGLQGPLDPSFRFVKIGTGTLTLTGKINAVDQTVVDEGRLLINGTVNGHGLLVRGGVLAGTGPIMDSDGETVRASRLVATGGIITAGLGAGVLHADAVEIATGASLLVDLHGVTPGEGYDQLALTDRLTLGADARLTLLRGFVPAPGTTFAIVTRPPARPSRACLRACRKGPRLAKARGGSRSPITAATATTSS